MPDQSTIEEEVQQELVSQLMAEQVEKGKEYEPGQVYLEPLYEDALQKAKLIMFVAKKNMKIESLEQKLEEQAYKDTHTGLYNKNAFLELGPKILEDASRSGRKMAALLLDLNNLKKKNDTEGHQAGDEYIANTGATILDRIRGGDFAFRIGGDEMLILVADIDEEGLETLAGNLSNSLEQNGISAAIGGGMIDLSSEQSRKESFKKVDSAMYEIKPESKKENGRSVNIIKPKVSSIAA